MLFRSVVGDGYFTGVVTSSNFYVNGQLIGSASSLSQLYVSGVSTLGVTSATNLTAQQLNVSGLSTFAGISTFQSTLFGTQGSFTGVVTATTFSGQVNAGIGTITTLSGTTATYTTGNFTTGNIVTGVVTTLTSTNASLTNINSTGISTLGVTSATNLTAQQLSVSGLSTFAGITTVTGTTLFATQFSNTGVSSFTNTTDSSSSTTGAVQISGGLGVAKNLFVGAGLSVTGVSTFAGITTVTGSTLFAKQLNVSGFSTLGVTTVTNLTAQSINSSGIITGSSFRPSSGYYQSPNGTNSFYVYDGTGNVAFQGTIGASQVNNSGGNKVIGFAGTNITFENDARVGNNLYVAGVSTFNGAITGTISTATALQNARTFEITGNFVTATAVSFDGTGNVALAATITPDSIGLGTYTSGDYVKNILGTSNQITVTSGTGEGSIPTLSIPIQFTAPQDVTVTRDLQVNRNLNVTGSITIGGTSAVIYATELKVADPDLVLGIRTDGSGNDISNDTTANHGGIAIASTEGNPLVSLYNPGIGESTSATYKKIMWFKSGAFSGLNTDAWLINYAVGIGSTQFPTGTRLAAGNVQFTQNDLALVRNINASGITTSSGGFVGNLTGTASTASLATTAYNLTDAANINTGTINSSRLSGTYTININGNASSSTYATSAGIATYATSAGIATYATSSGIATYATSSGIATYATNAGIATYATSAGIATYATSAGIATYATSAGIATYATSSGIATYATSSGIATNLKGGVIGNIPYQSATDTTVFLTNGASGTILQSNGVGNAPSWVTAAANGITVKYEGSQVGGANSVTTVDFRGSNISVASTAGIATITVNNNLVGTALSISGISTLGVTSATNLTAQQLNVSGVSTFIGISTFQSSLFGTQASFTGIVTALSFSGNASSATYATSAGIATYATSSGIATYATNAGVSTYASTAGVSTSVIGGIGSITQLSVSGVSTFTGISTFQSSLFGTQASFTGVVTASSFRGDGSQLTGVSAGLAINKNSTSVGTGVTLINFAGSGISSVTAAAGISTVTIPGTSKNLTYAVATAGQTSFSATYTVGFVDVFMNGVKLSDSSYTAINGTTVVLNEGASLGDVLEIVGYVITTPTYNITISTSDPSGGANGDIWIKYTA